MRPVTRKTALAGAAALAVIGTTLAYYNQTLEVKNELGTKRYSSELVEKFTPDDGIEPGSEINKDVAVKNTGDYDLVARIRYEDIWDGEEQPSTSGTLANKAYVTGDTILTYGPEKVAKLLDATEGTKWELAADGYYYCKEIIPAGGSVKFLDKLIVDPQLDMVGEAQVTYHYTRSETEPTATGESALDAATMWVAADSEEDIPDDTTFRKTVSEPGEDSYADKGYSLTIITEVLQASAAAVESAGWTNCPVTFE